jgi:type IV secretory pathway VirD2 relaxase
LSWVGSYGGIRKKNMMKNYKNTYQNTLIASGKNNLEELAKLTILNILSVQGVIYTHYKNKQTKGNDEQKSNRFFKEIYIGR